MHKLIELYKQWSGAEPAHTQQLPVAGSNRVYYRLTAHDGTSVVGVIGTSRDENHAFVYLCRHFSKRQLPVPKLLAVSDDELRYLESDLGSVSLFDAIRGGREAGGRYTLKEVQLLRRTIRELPNIQMRGARELDFSNCYPQAEFDVDSVLFDLNYFKYCFLKATELDFHELKLEADFRLLAKDLTSVDDQQAFLYRDFQARNVMLSEDGSPYFIDFQGGRKGPYRSSGRPLPNIRINCVVNWFTSTIMPSSTIPRCHRPISLSSASRSSCCSASYRYWVPMASVAISSANRISLRVSPLPFRTSANCWMSVISLILTSQMYSPDSPNCLDSNMLRLRQVVPMAIRQRIRTPISHILKTVLPPSRSMMLRDR